MIILADQMNTYSSRLVESLKSCGVDCPAISILYDGYLPEGVESPYGYYIGDYKSEGKPLFFGRIEFPSHQEIRAESGNAVVYEKNTVRSKVFDSETREKRYIRIVRYEHIKIKKLNS